MNSFVHGSFCLWCMSDSRKRKHRITGSGKGAFPVSSSRAKSRDLFRWRQEGERLTARNRKHRIAERRTVLPVNGLAKKSGKKGTEKISRYARNDSVGDGYPVHHTKNVWEKHVSRIVIGSGVEGSFSLAVRRRVADGEKRETPYRGKAVCHGNKKEGGSLFSLFRW